MCCNLILRVCLSTNADDPTACCHAVYTTNNLQLEKYDCRLLM